MKAHLHGANEAVGAGLVIHPVLRQTKVGHLDVPFTIQEHIFLRVPKLLCQHWHSSFGQTVCMTIQSLAKKQLQAESAGADVSWCFPVACSCHQTVLLRGGISHLAVSLECGLLLTGFRSRCAMPRACRCAMASTSSAV